MSFWKMVQHRYTELLQKDTIYLLIKKITASLNGDINKGTPEEAKALWEKTLKELGEDEVTVSINIADSESHEESCRIFTSTA